MKPALSFEGQLSRMRERGIEIGDEGTVHRSGLYSRLPFDAYYCNIIVTDMDNWVNAGTGRGAEGRGG